MQEPPSLETRLIRALTSMAIVAIAGVLAILPYRLYERDIRHARVDAHRVSTLVHAAISEALARGQDATDLINRFQSIADFEIHLTPLAQGEVHPAAVTRKATSRISGTQLDYTAPPILDGRGTTWLAEMRFDLTPMKRDSIRIIIDLVIAVLVGSLLFSLGIFFLVRNSILRPLRTLNDEILRRESSEEPMDLPRFRSREMLELTTTIDHLCRASLRHR